jgi:hypothetical protein
MARKTLIDALISIQLFFFGCGSGVLPSSVSTALKSGTYIGTLNCSAGLSYGGDFTVVSGVENLSVTIDVSGLPLVGGVVVAPGVSIPLTLGPIEGTVTVNNFTKSANGVTVSYRFYVSMCTNTCIWSFDQECDEIAFCELGTDCNDCGPTVVDGTVVETLQALENDKIRYIRSAFYIDGDALLSLNMECEGVLVR